MLGFLGSTRLVRDMPPADARSRAADLVERGWPEDPELVALVTFHEHLSIHAENLAFANRATLDLASSAGHPNFVQIEQLLGELNVRNAVARNRVAGVLSTYRPVVEACLARGYITDEEARDTGLFGSSGGLQALPLIPFIVLACVIVVTVGFSVTSWAVLTNPSVIDIARAEGVRNLLAEALGIVQDRPDLLPDIIRETTSKPPIGIDFKGLWPLAAIAIAGVLIMRRNRA